MADFDKQSERIISGLVPAAQPLFRALLASIQSAGIKARFISGQRSYAEQDKLYAQGRTQPGKIVTKAKGGFSWHNFGIAADIGIFVDGVYQDESPLYAKAGKIGRDMGLEWGGDWKSSQDEPHFQCRTEKTLADLRALVKAKGGDISAALAAIDALSDLPNNHPTPDPQSGTTPPGEGKVAPVEVFLNQKRFDMKAFFSESRVYVAVLDFVDYFGGELLGAAPKASDKTVQYALHNEEAKLVLRWEGKIAYVKFADINAVLGYNFKFDSVARRLTLFK